MEDVREVLRDHVGDMLAAEKHALESIEQQLDDHRIKSYPEFYDLVQKIQASLNRHLLSLEQYLSSLNGGGTSVTMKKAATMAAGALSGLYSRIRGKDPVSRDARDDYAALSLAAISYTMLHTTARALNESKLAALSEQHLNDLTPFIVALSRIIPEVVAQELAEEGKALYPTAAHEAILATQRAWSTEAVNQIRSGTGYAQGSF